MGQRGSHVDPNSDSVPAENVAVVLQTAHAGSELMNTTEGTRSRARSCDWQREQPVCGWAGQLRGTNSAQLTWKYLPTYLRALPNSSALANTFGDGTIRRLRASACNQEWGQSEWRVGASCMYCGHCARRGWARLGRADLTRTGGELAA